MFADSPVRLSRTSILLFIIFGQTVLLSFAWGFTGEILFMNVIALPDHIVHLIVAHPTDLTLIVTLISTILSIITSALFTLAVREAFQHHLSKPITLFKLRTAIALSTGRPTWVWSRRWEFLKLSALALAFYAVVTLLHTSWNTLLLPTLVQWPVGMLGTELDLGSVAFVTKLSTDLYTPEQNSVQAPAFETINVLTLLSGISAADIQGGVQTSSIFSFNGASYNRSTGGILPAIGEYSGSLTPPAGFGLAFSGGYVPVNTSLEPGHFGRDASTYQGITKNYTVTQQGVTANVTCQPIDHSQNSFTAISDVSQGPLNTFLTWEVTANCSGNSNSQIYYTVGNMSGQMDSTSEGLLPVVVCPNPNSTAFNPYKFDIFMSGLDKYSFLPTTVCEVVPYLTIVNVTYNGGIISVDPIGTSPGLTSSPSLPLSQYIATVMAYQSGTNQGMTTNTIGDFLTAYGANNESLIYSELEDYWRGIAEFASTQLRSGYSASGVPSNMMTSTNGTMYITTYGWESHARTYILLLVVITLIWGTTIFAAGYSLIQEKIHPSDPSFDFSDPVDLVIAASGGRLESEFCEGDRDKVHDITVRFEDVPGQVISKRLVTVVPESPA
ncbi:hypothetical protein BDR04DRAFT_1108633 [Suillus decipiens]|nr:hypothetical protein BDR04DRAFT_1108633 [Suillus decipiens]